MDTENNNNINSTPPQRNMTKISLKDIISVLVIVGVIVMLVKALAGVFFDFGDSGIDQDERIVRCAKQLIADAMKNPNSMIYNDAYIYEKDEYGRVIVCLDISAQNSFGGYNRSTFYVCLQNVDKDGTYTYNSNMYFCQDQLTLSLLKSMNHWNEHK